MKVPYTFYEGMPVQPFKKAKLESGVISLPPEILSEFFFKYLVSHEEEHISKQITNLRLVNKFWNQVCDDAIAKMCRKVSLETLFPLPEATNLNGFDTSIINMATMYSKIGNEDGVGDPLASGHFFVDHIPEHVLTFFQQHGHIINGLKTNYIFKLSDWKVITDYTNNLQVLCIQDTYDDQIECLLKLTKLEELQMNSEALSDKGMKLLANLPSLRTLILEGSCNNSLKPLSKLTNLTELYYDGQLADTDLLFLTTLVNLNCLGLEEYTPPNFDFITHLSKLTALEVLDMCDQSVIRDKDLFSICLVTSLQELSLGSCDFTIEGITHLSQLTDLRKLSLRTKAGDFSEDMIKFVETLTQLEELDIPEPNSNSSAESNSSADDSD